MGRGNFLPSVHNSREYRMIYIDNESVYGSNYYDNLDLIDIEHNQLGICDTLHYLIEKFAKIGNCDYFNIGEHVRHYSRYHAEHIIALNAAVEVVVVFDETYIVVYMTTTEDDPNSSYHSGLKEPLLDKYWKRFLLDGLMMTEWELRARTTAYTTDKIPKKEA